MQRARGLPVPDDWLVDAEGNAVMDPNVFMAGEAAMLPMGGSVGHKGYGLGMMVDAIAGGLSWAGCSADPPTRGASGWLRAGDKNRELHRTRRIQAGGGEACRLGQILTEDAGRKKDLLPWRNRGRSSSATSGTGNPNRREHLVAHRREWGGGGRVCADRSTVNCQCAPWARPDLNLFPKGEP